MAVPAKELEIDLDQAAEVMSNEGNNIKLRDEMMIVVEWKEMETTIYPQGKVMFFPLKDKALCIEYATEILGKLIDIPE
jgi:hypothetical protein